MGMLLLLGSLTHEHLCVSLGTFVDIIDNLTPIPLAPGKSTLLDILAQRKGGAVTGQVRQLSILQPPADCFKTKGWL